MKRSTRLALIAFAATVLLPFVYLVALSLSTRWNYPLLLPEAYSISAWRLALSANMPVTETLLRSLFISSLVATVSTVLGFVTGRTISRHRHRRRLLAAAYVPFIFSPVILGTTLMYFYLKAGLAGSITGVILSQIMFAFGFAIVFFDGFWTPDTRVMEEEARSLGCSGMHLFTRVLIPLSKSAIWLCLVQTFLISWFQYGLTLLIGAGRVRTLPLLVYEFVNEANPYLAAVASLLLILPPVLILLFNRRFTFRTAG